MSQREIGSKFKWVILKDAAMAFFKVKCIGLKYLSVLESSVDD